MRSLVVSIVVVASSAVIFPAAAVAQDAVVDPGLDTPAGAQYQIPLDSARQDAAPRPKPRRAVNGSKLQSENGFGSSSQVPGAPAAQGDREADGERPGGSSKGEGERSKDDGGSGAAGGSDPGSTGSAQAEAQGQAEQPSATPVNETSGPGSGSLLLLLVAAAGAAGAAFVARRA